MKYLLSILTLFILLSQWVFAANVMTNVWKIQTTSWYAGALPAGWEPKGFVGQVLADIFHATWLIKNEFITAFQTVAALPLNTIFENNILRWDGSKFVLWGMYDVAWNIWIGTDTPEWRLHINTTSDASFISTNHGLTIWNTGARNLVIDNNEILARDNGTWATLYIQASGTLENTIINEWGGNVWIGIPSPQTKLHVNEVWRFDGWVQVDGRMAVSETNYTHRAQATDDTHYGLFEVRNNSGTRGSYFGYGNGWDRVNLHLDSASYLNISWGNVWIGINSPTQSLDVNGKIRMRSQTSNGDSNDTVATKGYVIAQVWQSIQLNDSVPASFTCSWNGYNRTVYPMDTVVHNNRFMVAYRDNGHSCITSVWYYNWTSLVSCSNSDTNCWP